MKTGMPAFDSGMRGQEKPREKSETGGGRASKGNLRRFEVESSDNGGHIITVHRDPPVSAKKDAEGAEHANFQGPERHVHPTKEAAHQHVGALLDEMGGAAEKEGAAKSSFGKTAPNPKTE